VKGVGEVVAKGGRTRDSDGSFGKRRAIEREKALPRGVAGKRASLGEREVGKA
jgi:hypothetical protein